MGSPAVPLLVAKDSVTRNDFFFHTGRNTVTGGKKLGLNAQIVPIYCTLSTLSSGVINSFHSKGPLYCELRNFLKLLIFKGN